MLAEMHTRRDHINFALEIICLSLQAANGTQQEVGAFYNMTSNTFVPFHIAEHPFCSAHTLLPDGQAFVLGGESFGTFSPELRICLTPQAPLLSIVSASIRAICCIRKCQN